MDTRATGSVSAIRQNISLRYPGEAPFDPSETYCEFAAEKIFCLGQEENRVYETVRQCLIDCKLDCSHIATPQWSPFEKLLSPGMTVVIKPNLVLDAHDPSLQNTITTHASVIRPVIDYCWKAVGPTGMIIVGDAPQAEADFDKIISRNGLKDTVSILQGRGMNVKLQDFREIKVIMENGIWVGEQENSIYGQNNGIIVNLGTESLFSQVGDLRTRYHGGGYDSEITRHHHHGTTHEYKIAEQILLADAVISIPKLKTHKKAGLTCCLKNLVGINVDKNFLPHFTIGPQNVGGDEMPPVYGIRLGAVVAVRAIRDLVLDRHWRFWGKKIAKTLRILHHYKDEGDGKRVNLADVTANKISGKPVFQGAWPGNHTIWKMILDLNRIFLYAKASGEIDKKTVRNIFYVVDGISIGERNGPMVPSTVEAGLIACGDNALYLDTTLLKMLSVDPQNIPLYREALKHSNWLAPKGEMEVLLNGSIWDRASKLPIKLNPPDNWDF